MDHPTGGSPVCVAYFFSRFPHPTETFLQREVRAMRRLGLDLRLYSWHGGGREFEGLPVRRFSKWSLLTLFWRAWGEWWRHPALVGALARALFLTWPRDWMNHWENLYGAGIAAVVAAEFRKQPVDHIHATWASLPAMVAWGVSQFTGTSFSLGAHAYDLYEHGGDWFLREKCAAARFIHTSTRTAQSRLEQRGVNPARILLVRRGLEVRPEFHALRPHRQPLHIVCVARLVEKKGLLRQIALYRAARESGLAFLVRIVGDGPLRERLAAEIRAARLSSQVELVGAVDHHEVWRELARADVLVHTGVVTSSGDRDGLPNVVAEAMAAGVIVVTAPAPGVQEAIEHEVTGHVCALDDVGTWLATWRRIQIDDAWCEQVRVNARRWVESEFDAAKNAARILERLQTAAV